MYYCNIPPGGVAESISAGCNFFVVSTRSARREPALLGGLDTRAHLGMASGGINVVPPEAARRCHILESKATNGFGRKRNSSKVSTRQVCGGRRPRVRNVGVFGIPIAGGFNLELSTEQTPHGPRQHNTKQHDKTRRSTTQTNAPHNSTRAGTIVTFTSPPRGARLL